MLLRNPSATLRREGDPPENGTSTALGNAGRGRSCRVLPEKPHDLVRRLAPQRPFKANTVVACGRAELASYGALATVLNPRGAGSGACESA